MKNDSFFSPEFFWPVQYATGYHPVPEAHFVLMEPLFTMVTAGILAGILRHG